MMRYNNNYFLHIYIFLYLCIMCFGLIERVYVFLFLICILLFSMHRKRVSNVCVVIQHVF